MRAATRCRTSRLERKICGASYTLHAGKIPQKLSRELTLTQTYRFRSLEWHNLVSTFHAGAMALPNTCQILYVRTILPGVRVAIKLQAHTSNRSNSLLQLVTFCCRGWLRLLNLGTAFARAISLPSAAPMVLRLLAGFCRSVRMPSQRQASA